MAGDRIAELYLGDADQAFSRRAADEARERIDWMCSNVVGERVLDAGCSQGITSILLARKGKQVLGVDVDPEAVSFARKLASAEPKDVQQRIEFAQGELHTGMGAEFTTAIAGEVVEHLEDPSSFLGAMRELLAPDGLALLSTPFAFTSHHDHHHIFFLDNFLDMVAPFFEAQELFVRNKKIHYIGRRRDVVVDPSDADLELRKELPKRTNEAVIEMERKFYLPRMYELKKRVKQLEGWKTKYEGG